MKLMNFHDDLLKFILNEDDEILLIKIEKL